MRSWQIALVLVGVAAGCSKRKLHWSDTRATTVTTDGFVIPIPTGWRDAAESTDDDMRKLLSKSPGAHILVREDFDGATMVIKGGSNPPTPSPPCDEIATTIAKQEGAKATSIQKPTVDGDGACEWTYTKGDIEADYWMRFHGDKVLAVMCFAKGDKANAAACAQARKTAHPAP